MGHSESGRRFQFGGWPLMVLLTATVASCSGRMPDILENQPTHHGRVTGVVLYEGQPRAAIDILASYPPFQEVFADRGVTDAEGRFELYLQRTLPDGEAVSTMQMYVVAIARPPVVPVRVVDSVAVEVTFAPLGSSAPITTLAAPLQLP